MKKTKRDVFDYWWSEIQKDTKAKKDAEEKEISKPKPTTLTLPKFKSVSEFANEGCAIIDELLRQYPLIRNPSQISHRIVKETSNYKSNDQPFKKTLVTLNDSTKSNLDTSSLLGGISFDDDDDDDWDDFDLNKSKNSVNKSKNDVQSKPSSNFKDKRNSPKKHPPRTNIAIIDIISNDSNSSTKENDDGHREAESPNIFKNPDYDIPSDFDDATIDYDELDLTDNVPVNVVSNFNAFKTESSPMLKTNTTVVNAQRNESASSKSKIDSPSRLSSGNLSDELRSVTESFETLATDLFLNYTGREVEEFPRILAKGRMLIRKKATLLKLIETSKDDKTSIQIPPAINKSLHSPTGETSKTIKISPSPSIKSYFSEKKVNVQPTIFAKEIVINDSPVDKKENNDYNLSQIDFSYSDSEFDLTPKTSVTNHSFRNNNATLSKERNTEGCPGAFIGSSMDDGASSKFKGFNFPHSQKMQKAFRETFGLKGFRYNQLETINAALLNEDCFVLMPTGGGKSLCYQLPAVICDGVSVVISPLKSLIQDQVQKLNSLGIEADHLSGDLDTQHSNATYNKLNRPIPEISLLYVTPEKVGCNMKLLSTFDRLYNRNMLRRFIIDEAHCVSQWGHDFRPDYKRLCSLRERFQKVPLMALTATATPRVRSDILKQLKMEKPKWFLQSFNRPNLVYKIVPKKVKSVAKDVSNLIQEKFNKKSGIVYCLSRNDCDNQAEILVQDGIKAVSYHAGLNDKVRFDVQEKWINDQVQVICATIAFGMGIDKPDVRFVIHQSLPQSVECYYQESGRAGRDGNVSTCILFYNYQDKLRLVKLKEKDKSNLQALQMHIQNLVRVVQFCENKVDCRRQQMLQYFGEKFTKDFCVNFPTVSCDNCSMRGSYKRCDVTKESKIIIQNISDIVGDNGKVNLTLNYFVDIFRGSLLQKITKNNHDKISLHGIGKNFSRTDAERIVQHLVSENYLKEVIVTNAMEFSSSYLRLGPKAQELLRGNDQIVIDIGQNRKSINLNIVEIVSESQDLKKLKEKCFNELVNMSKIIGMEQNKHYNNVININALKSMSEEMPITETEMLAIPHVTRTVFDKCGKRFLEITTKYRAERVALEDDELAAKIEQQNVFDVSNVACASTTYRGRNYKRVATDGQHSGARKKFKGNFTRGRGRGYATARGGRSSGVANIVRGRGRASTSRGGKTTSAATSSKYYNSTFKSKTNTPKLLM